MVRNDLTAGETIRLEILKVLLPAASRHSISEPEGVVKIACTLERFVLESAQPAGESPDPARRKTLSVPPNKGKDAGKGLPEFMTPPSVDKSNQASGKS